MSKQGTPQTRPEKRLSIYRNYRQKLLDHIRSKDAIRQLSKEYALDYRTIERVIKFERKSEKEAVRERICVDIENKGNIDWGVATFVAVNKFLDALYDGKEMNVTERWAVDRVIRNFEKAKKTDDKSNDLLDALE